MSDNTDRTGNCMSLYKLWKANPSETLPGGRFSLRRVPHPPQSWQQVFIYMILWAHFSFKESIKSGNLTQNLPNLLDLKKQNQIPLHHCIVFGCFSLLKHLSNIYTCSEHLCPKHFSVHFKNVIFIILILTSVSANAKLLQSYLFCHPFSFLNCPNST